MTRRRLRLIGHPFRPVCRCLACVAYHSKRARSRQGGTFSCDIARPVSRAASVVPSTIMLTVAVRITGVVFAMAVERAKHRPEPVRVLAWL
jgi:hypothetical protein